MKKKVRFGDLKAGVKFKYKRRLCLKDDLDGCVRISNGVVDDDDIGVGTLVTPVKIKVEVV